MNMTTARPAHTLFGLILLCIMTVSAWADERMSTRIAASELNWKQLPNGRQISPVYGELDKGHHITFIKFSPGMKTPPHTHSNDYVGIVVAGTARHYQPGYAETKTPLPTGSIWSMPGNVVHVSECISDTECVFAIHQEGAFDIHAQH